MAELKIGKHCSVASCHILDFLPCPCNGCDLDYCKEHMAYESHQCPRKDLTGCRVTDSQATETKSYSCSFKDCDRRELVPINCEACTENFCLLHRHGVDHACKFLIQPQERMTQTAEHVRQILAAGNGCEKRKAAPKSAKAKATAAKVALMKLKQKAVGDKGIPDVDKVFFKIVLPLGSRITSAPVYLARTCTVGRAVDRLAASLNVKNENNVATAKRLCLFDSELGVMLPNDQLLSALLENNAESKEGEVYNGCTLIFEYIDRSLNRLPSLEEYEQFL